MRVPASAPSRGVVYDANATFYNNEGIESRAAVMLLSRRFAAPAFISCRPICSSPSGQRSMHAALWRQRRVAKCVCAVFCLRKV